MSKYYPGKQLDSGAVLVDQVRRVTSRSGHWIWSVRCTCGETVSKSSVNFTLMTCLCVPCAAKKRVELCIALSNSEKYRIGMVVAGVKLLAVLPAPNGNVRMFDTVCLKCEGKQATSRQRLSVARIACLACEREARAQRKAAKRSGSCETCGDLTHRVEGERCRDCGLLYAPEPELHAVSDLRSNAGIAVL